MFNCYYLSSLVRVDKLGGHEVPLVSDGLPLVGVGLHDVGDLDPGVGDDVGQVDRPRPPQPEDGQLDRGSGHARAVRQVFLILSVPGIKCEVLGRKN